MISYAETLYRQAHRYQKQRGDLLEEKAGKLKDLEKYRGSAGFDDDVKAVEKKYAELLDNMKYKFLEETEIVLAGMDKAISGRKMVAPSDAELRLLQALQMKSGSLTLDDLNEAGEALKGCPVGLSILDDLAKEAHYPARYHRLGQMPTQTAAEIISGLREQLRDFAETDRSRAGRLAARYNEKYGVSPSEVPKRKEFSSQEEFYSQFVGLDCEELTAFAEATGGAND